jgi:hypothetical protein
VIKSTAMHRMCQVGLGSGSPVGAVTVWAEDKRDVEVVSAVFLVNLKRDIAVRVKTGLSFRSEVRGCVEAQAVYSGRAPVLRDKSPGKATIGATGAAPYRFSITREVNMNPLSRTTN